MFPSRYRGWIASDRTVGTGLRASVTLGREMGRPKVAEGPRRAPGRGGGPGARRAGVDVVSAPRTLRARPVAAIAPEMERRHPEGRPTPRLGLMGDPARPRSVPGM